MFAPSPSDLSARELTRHRVFGVVRINFGAQYSVECFGSTEYGVASATSDLDMVILVSGSQSNVMDTDPRDMDRTTTGVLASLPQPLPSVFLVSIASPTFDVGIDYSSTGIPHSNLQCEVKLSFMTCIRHAYSVRSQKTCGGT